METVIVTGVGGGVGQSIVKSLQGSEYRIVGADAGTTATGLYAVDKGYQIPLASDPAFVDRLCAISEREESRLIFPGLDPELPVLAAAKERFASKGIQVVVSNRQVVAIGDDKLATANFLQSHGLPSPRTCLLPDASEENMSFPAVLKPRTGGSRSQGVFVVRNMEELRRIAPSLATNNYVAQEQIVGDEYTCGSVNFDGRCFGVITMRRILRDGDTYKAFVVHDSSLAAFVTKVMEALQPFGGCNTQLRIRNGVPYIFEFNARCSGTTYCRALAGFNEPLMVARYLLQHEEPRPETREIAIFRYWKELVVENADLATMMQSGEIDGNGIRL